MRLSWYGDTGVAVLSIWQGGRCTGTFRLPVDELPRMVDTLRRGPVGGPPELPGGPGAPDALGAGRPPARASRDGGDGYRPDQPGFPPGFEDEPGFEDVGTGYQTAAPGGGYEAYPPYGANEPYGANVSAGYLPEPADYPQSRPPAPLSQSAPPLPPPPPPPPPAQPGYGPAAPDIHPEDPLGLGYRPGDTGGYAPGDTDGYRRPGDSGGHRRPGGSGGGAGYRAGAAGGYQDGDTGGGYRDPAYQNRAGSYGAAEGRPTQPGSATGGSGYPAAPAYPAGDVPGYQAGTDTDYPQHDLAHYPDGGGGAYPPGDVTDYPAGPGRDYPHGDVRGYASGPPSRPSGSGPEPDPYHSWTGPDSGAHFESQGWPDDYPDSEDERYRHASPVPRPDARLATDSQARELAMRQISRQQQARPNRPEGSPAGSHSRAPGAAAQTPGSSTQQQPGRVPFDSAERSANRRRQPDRNAGPRRPT
jgi:hypothetical protein